MLKEPLARNGEHKTEDLEVVWFAVPETEELAFGRLFVTQKKSPPA